jgi:anti-sigma B factor antagonist
VVLTIGVREVGDVTVLDLRGRISFGEGSVQLREAVHGLIGKGARNILLNLEQVSHIDSSGLGELVSAYTAARNQHGEVKLLNPVRKIYDLLQLTKLSTVFDIRDDEASAIASFSL